MILAVDIGNSNIVFGINVYINRLVAICWCYYSTSTFFGCRISEFSCRVCCVPSFLCSNRNKCVAMADNSALWYNIMFLITNYKI